MAEPTAHHQLNLNKLAPSYDDMVRMVQEGKSIITSDGRHIDNIDQLPSRAELARGNPEQAAIVRRQLEAEIAARKRQLEMLSAPAGTEAPQTALGARLDTPVNSALSSGTGASAATAAQLGTEGGHGTAGGDTGRISEGAPETDPITVNKLERLNKEQLIETARRDFGVDAKDEQTKAEIIALIEATEVFRNQLKS